MKQLLFILMSFAFVPSLTAQLRVSADKHYLIKNDGSPFFWLGDTAWELFHRLNREEAREYLQNRADKGFTVIQAVILAELDGLNTPNAYGDKPLINNDPTQPNEAYFKHVDFIIKEANKKGLIVAMLPSWGDKWSKGKWGKGPEIFTPVNAEVYGAWLAKRYLHNNVVYVLGGDRNLENETHYAIIRAMAAGIKAVDKGKHLLSFHPYGGSNSFDFFAADTWIDFHMTQSGHKAGNPDYKANIGAYSLATVKPMVNSEPNYEDHPNDWNPLKKGWMDDFDTREAAYWNMLSGGAGHTYGNHNIWQMYTEQREVVNNARTNWHVAMDYRGAYDVGYMRKMFEKRNWQKLVMDQSAIVGENPEGIGYAIAAVSSEKDFMMVYIPDGRKTTLHISKLNATKIRGWWFNPRDGYTIPLGDFENKGNKEFIPTSVGRGSDWVLVLDDAAKNYTEPNAY
ncbi:glycoside hydrolase family 140 protein [soil metagenome]